MAIDRLFKAMCAVGASDLHLSVGAPPLVRKDGRLEPLTTDLPALTSEMITAPVSYTHLTLPTKA